MILTIFIIGVIFAAICLFIGASQQSFPFLYLGWFIILLLGMFTLNEGIAIDNGMQEIPLHSHNFVTVWEVYTAADDPVVSVIANTFFYLPFAAILLTTLMALR